MSFEYSQKIPSLDEIIEEIPISSSLSKIKETRDTEIINIFLRKSKKFLIIIGPCSADNEDAVCEYVSRLAKLQNLVLTSF